MKRRSLQSVLGAVLTASAIIASTTVLGVTFASKASATELEVGMSERLRELGFRDLTEVSQFFEFSEITLVENNRAFTPEELAVTSAIIINNSAHNSPSAKLPKGKDSSSIGEILLDLTADLGDVRKWITLGEKLWEVVKNNQPIMNVQTHAVSVLPEALPHWTHMETWKGPQAKSYTIAAKNLYGITVISHTYTVAFHHGGSYQGQGQFLANATILSTGVDVSWGFTLNSEVKVGAPLNTGTKQSPIPGVDLALNWNMSSILKKAQGTDQFFVRGDGTSTHTSLR
ncbi:MAG: hypothetical protein RBT63_03035 [Bdellovibrionales bacterium]|jgi:hypothetical protein|nr:hypothetical protein [Bdellovibrionales bacterium]